MRQRKAIPFRPLLVGLILLASPFAMYSAEPKPPSEATPPTLWIIPHTHWEGAVFKSREDYLEMGLPHILTALRLLDEYPDYRFALDQVAYFRPFLDRYPEDAPAFRNFVSQGRLAIVGGTDVMPDDNMPSGESFIRQMLYGKDYCRETFGTDVKTGWLLDTFGHNAQMPQLLRLAGFDSFWFFRGVPNAESAPVESLWQGLDGTTIHSFKPPFVFYDPPKDQAGFTKFIEKRYESLAPFPGDKQNRVILDAGDVTDPELYVPKLVEEFNRQPNMPFRLRYGVPTDFEAAVAHQTDLPLFKGERNPIYEGVYSSRIELKQRMRETERLLTTTEKFGAMANLLGAHIDNQMIWGAWEPALFNVTHDLASGVMTDYVYADTVRSYDFSQRLGSEMAETRLSEILQHIDTQGAGIPIVVFNTLGWVRTDAVQAQVGFAQGGIKSFDLVDASGKIVPAQITQTNPYADGALRQVKFTFVARDVPSMGYAVYHVIPRSGKGSAEAGTVLTGAGEIDNDLYRARFDARTGALVGLRVKQGDWEALSGPANVVAEEGDQGDFWELNHNLNGSQSTMMTRPVMAPQRKAGTYFSDDFSGEKGTVTQGPVFSQFHIQHKLADNDFETTVTVYAGLPRIEFSTRLLNRDKHVRYRVSFPTSITDGKNFQEIPFGAIERRQNAEFPAQNWIDFSNSQKGVALLNRGLPGNNVANGALTLSLLRSVRIQAYNIWGGYTGQSSDSGLELNREFNFHYALMPHEGDWGEARVYRAGLEFNNPLIAHAAASQKGTLPKRWGVFTISPGNVVLSAFKPSKDGTAVVRVYEADGRATPASIQWDVNILAAHEANLLEDPGREIRLEGNTIRFDLHPFEIKTFRVSLADLTKSPGKD